MKRFNREINVFNMSAIDLFASAMGAFMLLALVTLPFYLNEDAVEEQIARLMSENEQLQQQRGQADAALRQLQEEGRQQQRRLEELDEQIRRRQRQIQSVADRLSKNILAVMINWYTNADMDLHVETPTNHKYSYKNHNRKPLTDDPRPNWPNEEAELSFDAGVDGAGNAGIEVWTMADAVAGTYTISVDKFSANRDVRPTRVEMTIFCGNRVERKTLEGLEGTKKVAAIKVGGRGDVDISWF